MSNKSVCQSPESWAYAMGTYHDLHSYRSSWYEFGDSQAQWIKNCQDHDNRIRLATNGWLDENCITYDINAWGFRSTDLTQPVDLAVFGDSYTMGVGLPESCLWHRSIGQQQQWRVANFGVAGAASRTCWRLAHYWLPRLRPRRAIFIMPHSTRLEVATEATDGCMTTPYVVAKDTNDEFLKRWWLTDFNAQQERQITEMALKHLCHGLDIQTMFFAIEFFEQTFQDYNDLARDLSHAGKMFQRRIAEYISGSINNGQWH